MVSLKFDFELLSEKLVELNSKPTLPSTKIVLETLAVTYMVLNSRSPGRSVE